MHSTISSPTSAAILYATGRQRREISRPVGNTSSRNEMAAEQQDQSSCPASRAQLRTPPPVGPILRISAPFDSESTLLAKR